MKLMRFFLVLFFLGFITQSASAEIKEEKISKEEIKRMAETNVVIETKFGNIELRFFPDVAPHHVNNFIELAKKGFYDGTTFHRVIPGFMIQGGDPNSRNSDKSDHGMGGPGYTIKGEGNNRPHRRGTLSMARTATPAGTGEYMMLGLKAVTKPEWQSSGSQFFICVDKAPWLDKQFTVFGEVVSGMDVADKIVGQSRDAKDNPNERVEIQVKVIENK